MLDYFRRGREPLPSRPDTATSADSVADSAQSSPVPHTPSPAATPPVAADTVTRISLFPTCAHWSIVPAVPPATADDDQDAATSVEAAAPARVLNVQVKGWAHRARTSSFRRNLVIGISRRLLSPVRTNPSKDADDAFNDRMGMFLDEPVCDEGAIKVVVNGFLASDGLSSNKASTSQDAVVPSDEIVGSGSESPDAASLAGSNTPLPKTPSIKDATLPDSMAVLEALEATIADFSFSVCPKIDAATGLFSEVIEIPETAIQEWMDRTSFDANSLRSTLQIIAYKASGEHAGTSATTTCSIIPDTPGISVITDLDDTIKNSDVHRGAGPAFNTAFFTPDSVAVPDMAELFDRLHFKLNAAFHYVSAGPFQLVDMINKFLVTEGFPAGSLNLRYVWKETSRRAYKDGIISDLFSRFPARKFILIGDSGEKDAEVYARVMKEYPGRVAMILIRDVSDGADAEKLRIVGEALKDVPDKCKMVFRDPKTAFDVVARAVVF
ncbi:hypothetical protein HDU83_004212 [Entophlyctis luteolus]|nr:hypothetical protein HDU83_004212 [Entophlyctis luteolus]